MWQRRRKWPDFARRMEEVLEDAEVRLEFRMATMGNDSTGVEREDGIKRGDDGVKAEALAFDPDLALRFLKWREEKRRGRVPKSGRAWQRPRTLDEVKDSILRKLKAISRHSEAERLAQGWTKDEEGRMIPPGWVRAP